MTSLTSARTDAGVGRHLVLPRLKPSVSPTMDAHELVTPNTTSEWATYHTIRGEVLWEARGLVGIYNENHPDEAAPNNIRSCWSTEVIRLGWSASTSTAPSRRFVEMLSALTSNAGVTVECYLNW